MIQKNFSIYEAFKYAIVKSISNWWLFVKIGILTAITIFLPWIFAIIAALLFVKNQSLGTIIATLTSPQAIHSDIAILFHIKTACVITSYLLYLWVSSGFSYACLHLYDQQEVEPSDIFMPKLLAARFIITSMLSALLIFLGFICFIIPGFIAMACYSFAPYITLDLDYSSSQSLTYSRHITKSKRLKILVFMFANSLIFGVLYGLTILISAIFNQPIISYTFTGISSFILTPITNLAWIYVYRQLQKYYIAQNESQISV